MGMSINTVELESSVIGAALIDFTTDARDALELLNPEAFTDQILRCCFESIRGLDNGNEVIDLITVSELVKRSFPSAFGYLAELAKNTPSAANVKAYAARLRELHGVRVAAKKLQQASELLLTRQDAESASTVVSIALDALNAGRDNLRWEYADQLAEREVQRLERTLQEPDKELGFITGIAGIDAALGRLNRTDLVVIAGRPGMGKTELALTIADAYAVEQDRASLFFSMEMEGGQVSQRVIARGGGIAAGRMIDPRDMEDADFARVANGMIRLKGKKFAFCDKPNLTLPQVRNLARKFAQHHQRLGGIFIDYLTLMEMGQADRRDIAIGDITRGLKSLAQELKMPVFVLSQLNRSLESRPNKRPVMADLRDSGAIEQDADRVLFPYRDIVYHDDSHFGNCCELISGKNRHQKVTTGWLTFQDGHFYDVSESDQLKIANALSHQSAPRKQNGKKGAEVDEF